MEAIVFYDGACPLCSRVVRLLLRHEKNNSIKFAMLQGSFAKEFLSKNGIVELDFTTFYLFLNNTLYSKSSAALHLIPFLKWYFLPLGLFWVIPKSMRDLVYDIVARNRYNFFKNVCELGGLDEERSLDL